MTHRLLVGALLLLGAFVASETSASSARTLAARHISAHFLITVAPYAHGRLSMRASVDVVNRRGTVERVVAPAGAPYPHEALWSPDDSMIAWAARDGINVETADGSAQRLLVPASSSCTGSCTILEFVWSPDSRALAVGGAGALTNELLLVPVDGSPPQTLVPTLPDSMYNPAFWTPDGASLVYGSSIGSPGSAHCCHADISVVMPSTGETRTMYTTPNVRAQLPLFSPNLRYRVVIKDLSQYRRQLRIIDNSTGRTRVVKSVNPTNFLGWSPDSRTLAVVESGWHVASVDAATADVHQIGRGLDVYWSRDGELLVQRGTYNQIWVSTNGRPERFLFKSPNSQYITTIDGD